MSKKVKVAAVLLLVTAVIHMTYPFIYHNPEATRPVAVFGLLYFIIAIGILVRGKKSFLWAGAILTTVGMTAATFVYVNNPEPFDLDIVLILFDLVIVPVFWWGIFNLGKNIA